ncbi:MAG: YceI family protein [Acidobacteriota bacterium]
MTRPSRRIPTTSLRFSGALLAGALIVGALLAGPPAAAREMVVRFDPETTEVTFAVNATGHDVHGSFAFREGEIRFDPETGTASGELVVDATRGETGNGSRDKTMHGKVLESERFPLFVFHADELIGEVAPEGESSIELRGRLEIHGDEHPLSIPATVVRTGERVRSSARFKVPYQEWGMHNPSFLFLRVGPEVEVTVAAEGSLRSADGMAADGMTGGKDVVETVEGAHRGGR